MELISSIVQSTLFSIDNEYFVINYVHKTHLHHRYTSKFDKSGLNPDKLCQITELSKTHPYDRTVKWPSHMWNMKVLSVMDHNLWPRLKFFVYGRRQQQGQRHYQQQWRWGYDNSSQDFRHSELKKCCVTDRQNRQKIRCPQIKTTNLKSSLAFTVEFPGEANTTHATGAGVLIQQGRQHGACHKLLKKRDNHP